MVMQYALASFRGFTAPASLKGRGRGRTRHCPSWFPGLYRPGLIEGPHRRRPSRCAPQCFRGFTAPASLKAIGRTRGEASRRRRFRGFTAPASLKAAPTVCPVPMRASFRGFTAPASLKAGFGVVAIGHLTRFPGLYRPGLIEGSSRYASLHGTPTVSGALPPRPH